MSLYKVLYTLLRHRILQYGLQAWIVLICDPDIAIALIVFQQDIILRGILLYKRTLQDKCLELGVGDDKVIVIDVGHHFHTFGR